MDNYSLLSNHQRHCCVCDSKLHGRKDKVFCNYKCKNKYHSSIRKDAKSVNSQTIDKLIKNYNLLLLYNGNNNSKFTLNKLELTRKGFSFEIVSGVEINKYGLKFQVFEFSWYIDKNQNITVYRDPNHNILAPFVYKRWNRHLKNKQT